MSACFACGIATSEPDVVTVEPIALEGGTMFGKPSSYRPSVKLGRCPICEERHALAARMLDADPKTVARIGSRLIAEHRLECALDALAAIGLPLPKVEDQVLPLLVHLSDVGATVRWSYIFGPIWQTDADPEGFNIEPWAHITDFQMVRDSVGRLLADRFAATQPDKHLPPPPPSVACLFCGVGEVEASALRVSRLGGAQRAAEQLWRHVSVNPQTLRSPRRDKPVEGHLCPGCADAADAESAIGHRAMKLALMRYLKTEGRRDELAVAQSGDLHGLTAWAVLEEQSANRQPWDHIKIL